MGEIMKDLDKMSKTEKIEFLEDALNDATLMISKFMAFVNIKGLVDEFYEFSPKFDNFIESGIEFDGEDLDIKLKEYLEDGGSVRNA
jgi:hypothetical protein